MKQNRTSLYITLIACLAAVVLLFVLGLTLPSGDMLFTVLK